MQKLPNIWKLFQYKDLILQNSWTLVNNRGISLSCPKQILTPLFQKQLE